MEENYLILITSQNLYYFGKFIVYLILIILSYTTSLFIMSNLTKFKLMTFDIWRMNRISLIFDA